MSFLDSLYDAFGERKPVDTPAPAPEPQNVVTVASGQIATTCGTDGHQYITASASNAMKLSAVNRCVEILSDSVGKLPIYVIDRNTKQRITDHSLLQLLSIRPNAVQTPFSCMKMIECNRLCDGNGYGYIVRDKLTMKPVEIVPIPAFTVTKKRNKKTGALSYSFIHPFTDKQYTNIDSADMIHVMAYSSNGYEGVSVLSRAAEVIGTGKAAQDYSLSYYSNGGQPSGVLTTESDLGGDVQIADAAGNVTTKSRKDIIREEWNKRYSGPTNAGSVAVLDYGLKYSPISISNRDAQFVEQTELSVQDIARFFGVPLYKLQAGKQSYSSNEQNAVEYVVGTLHPIVEQYEQELTYKLLTESEIAMGLEIRINMLAELKGDTASRSTWYRNMREISVFSPNDIRELEDLPDIEGGDEYAASLNYAPLSIWAELSKDRAAGRGGINQ